MTSSRRWIFVLTILSGSFLLFLVQPMIARMALPMLGGAPNVWNSAMLVFQALLLGGYAYAHFVGRFTIPRQAAIHLTLLVLAALTLPLHLAALAPPAPGQEALWVPLLLLLSVGPVFFVISAQAPLLQRWYSADPQAGAPWALYAASNLGSFAGLIAYPLLAEPLLALRTQALWWSAGYAVLIALIALAAWSRRGLRAQTAVSAGPAEPIPARRIALWLVLAAVPSGLMLSTTTHLTTDLFAMPLLWVIPLGLYLLSFVPAFADHRGAANVISRIAPVVLLIAGGMAMVSRSTGSLVPVFGSIALLFVIAVALHARLYALRPAASQLTLFYLVMSAGGVLGGILCALIAPLVFDWAWEHPLLVFAAALLLEQRPLFDRLQLPGLSKEGASLPRLALVAIAAFAGWLIISAWQSDDVSRSVWVGGTLAIAVCGILAMGHRGTFMRIFVVMLVAQGGIDTVKTSFQGMRTRSYFGIYTVRDFPADHQRSLSHGTTLHGVQWTDAARRCQPTTYYGRGSGLGIAFANAPTLYGPAARIGVVGLGTGTAGAYYRPGETWRVFEIDPAIAGLSQDGTFTFLQDCAPAATITIGDARLALAKSAPASLDLLAIDAFSSDAIPLHLMTDEAFSVYERTLSPQGVLLVHISNRYIELRPVLAAIAARRGLATAIRNDYPDRSDGTMTASSWVAMARDPARLAALTASAPASPWEPLPAAATTVWTDDHASILPYIRWRNLLGK